MQKRIAERFGSQKELLAARLRHAQRERQASRHYDHKIGHDNPQELAKLLAEIALELAGKAPQPPASGLLTDKDILASLEDPKTALVHTDEGDNDEIKKRVHGWSVDLTLSPNYYRVRSSPIFRRVFDLADGTPAEILRRFREESAHAHEPILLRKNEFILGATNERVVIPHNAICIISGRTSYSRLGISIEFSQNILQPGHQDRIPLQIKNNLPYPILIYPNMLIAQAGFIRMASTVAMPYSRYRAGKYLDAAEDRRTRFYDDVVFTSIRDKRPKRNIVDWDYNLNALLLLLAWFAATSLTIEMLPPFAGVAAMAKTVKFYSFLTALPIALARTARFFLRK
jgi:dCTP deaminase